MRKKQDFKVIPNLSLKGKDVLNRLNNRTLILGSGGVYNSDEQIEATRKMDKIEILQAARENAIKIGELNERLNNLHKPL